MTTATFDGYRTDPAKFIDDFLPLNEKGKTWRLSPHQRKVLKLAFRWTADGRLDLVRYLIWGEIKKSGKTMVAACLTLWWSFTRPWSEVVIVAGDFEQARGRVFKTVAALIHHNQLTEFAEVRSSTINLTNGTLIEAIPLDYQGEAGRRQSLVVWDEPWNVMSGRAQRLHEELTPPPSEPEAWMLFTTYAGFSGESILLERLYHDALTGERLDTDLEVYRKGSVTMFWSHIPRQPWQTPEYYLEQRQTLRPNAYLRLHENRWVTGTSTFIPPELWDQNVVPTLRPIVGAPPAELFVGVDAGIKIDNAAVVAVFWTGQQLALAAHRIWKPTPTDPLDLEATIEAFLRELHARGNVAEIVCDPYQLHRSITTLRAAGLPIREYPQTSANLTAAGQTLFDLLQGRNLQLYPAPDLRQQALHTVAVESSRGWRIAKEKASHKIDAIVALAMACRAAVDQSSTSGAGMFDCLTGKTLDDLPTRGAWI